MAEMLAVRVDEQGIVHQEDGKLIVGDLDVIRMALAAWGGNRQRGRVVVELYLENRQLTNTSPDFSGYFTEGTEPPAGGGLG